MGYEHSSNSTRDTGGIIKATGTCDIGHLKIDMRHQPPPHPPPTSKVSFRKCPCRCVKFSDLDPFPSPEPEPFKAETNPWLNLDTSSKVLSYLSWSSLKQSVTQSIHTFSSSVPAFTDQAWVGPLSDMTGQFVRSTGLADYQGVDDNTVSWSGGCRGSFAGSWEAETV